LNRSIAAMTDQGVPKQHQHFCPRCGHTYPGYKALCAEPKILLCGRCLAKLFVVNHRRPGKDVIVSDNRVRVVGEGRES
jgi:ribosomal protein S27AE